MLVKIVLNEDLITWTWRLDLEFNINYLDMEI